MKESTWESLTVFLLVVAAVVAVAMVVVAAMAMVAVAVVVVAPVVAPVVVVAAAVKNPRLSCAISTVVIAVCLISLFFTLPVALNPPQTVQVVCQQVSATTFIFIHSSATQTIVSTGYYNQTITQIATKVTGCA